jgi:hypothetical protein
MNKSARKRWVKAQLVELREQLEAVATAERAEHERAYLHSELEHIGVANPELRRIARAFQKTDEAIMALLFSGTELLGEPVPWAELQAILEQERGRNNQLQRPLQITPELFFRIYERASPSEGSRSP